MRCDGNHRVERLNIMMLCVEDSIKSSKTNNFFNRWKIRPITAKSRTNLSSNSPRWQPINSSPKSSSRPHPNILRIKTSSLQPLERLEVSIIIHSRSKRAWKLRQWPPASQLIISCKTVNRPSESLHSQPKIRQRLPSSLIGILLTQSVKEAKAQALRLSLRPLMNIKCLLEAKLSLDSKHKKRVQSSNRSGSKRYQLKKCD